MSNTFHEAIQDAVSVAKYQGAQRIIVQYDSGTYNAEPRCGYTDRKYATPLAIVLADGTICEIFRDGFTPIPLTVKPGDVVEIQETVNA